MMTRTYTRKRQSRTGILAAGILAAGLLAGTTGAAFELAAPSPVTAVHSAAPAPVPWPQPGEAGGGPVTSAPASASGTHSHTLLKAAGRMVLRHVFHVHGFYIRRPRLLPWWLRSNR